MKIAAALDGVSLLYVETAPFIYYTERRAGYVERMHTIFSEVSQNRIRVLTSAVTLTETLMKPLRENDAQLVRRYRTMLYRTRGLMLVSISPGIGDAAAELRARYNLRTPDALHLATAVDYGCDAFLTNDGALKRVAEINVLVLDELDGDQPES